MISISEYKPEYRDQVLELVREFEAEYFGAFGLEVNPETFDDAVESQRDSSFLLFIDGKLEGLLSGTLSYGFGLKGLMWQEVIWYVRKKHRRYGIKLFKAAYEALKERGVKAIIAAHLDNEMGVKMSKFYKRLGFKQLETHYIQRFE